MLLLLAAVIWQNTPPQKITYETKAKPLTAVLADIGEQTHLKLSADSILGVQPLIVSLHDASLRDAFANIAKATCGFWQKTDSGYQLRLDGATLQSKGAKYHSEMVKMYSAVLANYSKELQKQAPITLENAAKYLAWSQKQQDQAISGRQPPAPSDSDEPPNQTQTPLARACSEALVTIGPEALASVGNGDRVVYSTRPTPMQRGLGDAGQQLLSEYVNSARLWNQASATVPKDANAGIDLKSVNGMFNAGDGMDDEPEKTTKLLLVLQTLYGNLVQARLYAIHGDQKLGSPADEQIYPTNAWQQDEQAPKGESGQSQPATPSHPIKLSPDSKFLTTAFASALEMLGSDWVFSGSPFQKLEKRPADLRDQLLRPDMYDPLSFGESEALLQLATEKHVQLVALLPDSVVGQLGGSGTLEELESAIGIGKREAPRQHHIFGSWNSWRLNDLDASLDSGWLTIAPRNPEGMIENRVDRGAMAVLIHSWADPKVPHVEALSSFYATRYRQNNSLAATYVSILDPTMAVEMVSKAALGFYGNLTVSNRQQLMGGGVLRVQDIGDEARNALAYGIYGTSLPLSDAPSILPEAAGMAAMFMPGNEEPTEVLQSGLPPDGSVRLNTKVEKQARIPIADMMPPSMMAMAPQMPDISVDLGATELASYKVMKSEPRFAKSMFAGITLSKMRLIQVSTLHFDFQFAPKVFSQAVLQDKLPLGDHYYKFDDLPSDLQQQIAGAEPKAREMMAKMPSDMMNPFMGKQQNPPPR